MALTKPFCENGKKTTIPQTTDDGSVSYDQGFGAFYALPPEEGGLFIDRAQFNQLMFDTTSAIIDNSNNITTIQGDVTTAKANIATLQGKISVLEGDVSSIENTISEVISSDVTPIGAYKTVENKTIGTNGDFKTFEEALVYAQTHQSQSPSQGLTLTLLEDLEAVPYIYGAWYPYLVIDCNGFKFGNGLTIDLSCFMIRKLKTGGRVAIGYSNIWIRDDIEINYSVSDYPPSCLTAMAGSTIVIASENINLSPISTRGGIASTGNSMIYLTGSTPTITQTAGVNCLQVIAGGLIELYNNNLNLDGVDVPKASQAANTLTRNGIIFGNYSL